MTALPTLTEEETLLVVRSLAQVHRSGGESPVSEASLFLQVDSLERFSPGQKDALALAVLRFFDLDADGDSATDALRSELCSLARLEDWARIVHDNWKGESLSFHSSGSTGIPVRHSYTIAILADEGAVLVPYCAGRKRIVSVMPVHHIFGFMHSFWLAKWLDIPVVYAPPLPLASFFDALREGDMVVGFPFFWQSLLAVVRQKSGEGALRMPPNVTGLTATSPCPEWVIAGLLEPLPEGGNAPLAAMEEIYGSTETNGLGIRRGGTEWYALYANWETLRLPDGTRAIRRLHGGAPFGELHPLPDVAIWHPEDERRFKPMHRTDKAVQVGGINVYPERVAACIRTHPLVRDCAVRLMRPEEGSRLKAFIVPDCPPGETAAHFGKNFRVWLAERLDTPARPKRFRFGASLPVNPVGKASDWD